MIKQEIEIGFMPVKELKKFYCTVKDLCYFKQEFVNQRCFAPYVIRATCRYLANKEQTEKISRE